MKRDSRSEQGRSSRYQTAARLALNARSLYDLKTVNHYREVEEHLAALAPYTIPAGARLYRKLGYDFVVPTLGGPVAVVAASARQP